MKFIVTRTSMYLDEKPCESATKQIRTRIFRFGPRAGEKQEVVVWVVEINSLQELLDFQSKQEESLILSYLKDEGFALEIYDDYRE